MELAAFWGKDRLHPHTVHDLQHLSRREFGLDGNVLLSKKVVQGGTSESRAESERIPTVGQAG